MDETSIRMLSRIFLVKTVDVREQNQSIRLKMNSDLRGKRVIVAELDLFSGARVIFVADRHHSPLQKLVDGVHEVFPMFRAGKVIVRQQYLGPQHSQRLQGE